MKDRIRAVRKDAGLSQKAFGESLGASLSAAAKWESGENLMSDTTILLLCQKFRVSETWLRTGVGEMRASETREEEMGALVAALMADRPESFRAALVTVLLRFDPSGPEWTALERIYDKLRAETEKAPGD